MESRPDPKIKGKVVTDGGEGRHSTTRKYLVWPPGARGRPYLYKVSADVSIPNILMRERKKGFILIGWKSIILIGR